MGTILVILGVVAGVCILWKLVGAALNVGLSGHDRKVRQSTIGTAIRSTVDASGFNDGEPHSRQAAHDCFLDLASNAPFELTSSDSALAREARLFADDSIASRWPLLVDAAWTVVQHAPNRELADWHQHDANTTTTLTSNFMALFPGWAESHKVGTVSELNDRKLRMAAMYVMLGDRAEREGVLVR